MVYEDITLSYYYIASLATMWLNGSNGFILVWSIFIQHLCFIRNSPISIWINQKCLQDYFQKCMKNFPWNLGKSKLKSKLYQGCESSALKLISALLFLLKYPKMCLFLCFQAIVCVFSTISALFLNSHSHPCNQLEWRFIGLIQNRKWALTAYFSTTAVVFLNAWYGLTT